MPKPLPRRSRRPETVAFGLRRWLISGERTFWYFIERQEPEEEVWKLHEADVLEHFTKKRPGRRPKLWWKLSSPEPRRRLGGTGDCLADCLPAVVLLHEFGVPSDWNVAGDNIPGTPISNTDPPRFESEASYLLRHGLLLDGEEEQLGSRAFDPVVLKLVKGRFCLLRYARAH
jgi:hypothetical protein